MWELVPRLLTDNRYLVLATADRQGRPWAAPVFFAARDEDRLFWVSAPDSRHSRNIAERPDVAITVFDSHAPTGGAEALLPGGDRRALRQRHRRTAARHTPSGAQPRERHGRRPRLDPSLDRP
ncbi:pyridoxamine 5'-phosphate oxidase family protein [Nonomuraea angiospora]|uniref:pyridoxamine 5'-phosphate oxidase family protein n=1 Tax=Nonomuraea angiospora TaxID=46172 RepID=UPI00341E98D4